VIKFYFHHTPNPMKVALLLEELGLEYETVPVDIFKGEQHDPRYLDINPNAKVPAIVDGDVTVFDSNGILLYLSEKHGRFLPETEKARGLAISWLFFVATGLSPFSGQASHFLRHAPEQVPYAIDRYVKEVERHYQVLDQRLANNRYLAGDDYSIADMALWGWARIAFVIFGDAGLSAYPNVQRLHDEISRCPAARRAEALQARFEMKKDVDEETRQALFASHRAQQAQTA
jgi:GSH-dependent disulfide-bond oxidoreductase